jgi:hypothetical protein
MTRPPGRPRLPVVKSSVEHPPKASDCSEGGGLLQAYRASYIADRTPVNQPCAQKLSHACSDLTSRRRKAEQIIGIVEGERALLGRRTGQPLC